MKHIIFCLLCLSFISGQCQELYSIHSAWDDSFIRWEIETDYRKGEIYLRWPERGNWLEWDYSIGISSGEIRQKWTDNPNAWVLRGDGETVTMRTVWRNDFTQWRIDDGEDNVTLISRYNSMDEWLIRESDEFKMHTSHTSDPRDWEYYEDVSLDLSLEMRLAIAFIAIYHGSPKR